MIRRTSLIAVAAVGLLFACSSLLAQDAGQRASELAASLDKTKYKKKEKRNFSLLLFQLLLMSIMCLI